MLRIVLAIAVLITAALAPAAAMKAAGDSHHTTAVAQSHCDCCDEMRIDAALTCAAFCQAALPSIVGALPTVSLSRLAPLAAIADGEGLTLEPPAPPPRS